MILPFGVSWLCPLLLWGCICFPPQKSEAGYSVNNGGLSSHEGVLGPETFNQFNSGASLSTNYDSVSPKEEKQATRHQSFVSPQREQVQRENSEDYSSVPSLSEEVVQSKPLSGHEPEKFSVDLSAQAYERESSAFQHPFGLLVRNTQKETWEGVSFPTIKDFRRFIQTLKGAFLIPGSDLRRHFQTAQEIIENKVASNAHHNNGEPDTGYKSNSAHDDVGENGVGSAPMKAVFEPSQQSGSYQMPSKSLSVPDPVDFTASPSSASVHEYHSSASALYTLPQLTAKDHVSSNSESFDNGANPGKDTNIFTSVPEQIPSGSFFVDLSFSDHVTASPVNPTNSPSQDFNHYSSKTSNVSPLTSENNVPQLQPTPHGKDSLTIYQELSGGLELAEDFQSEELGRGTQANVLSPRSMSSYGKSIYVNAPRRQFHIPDYLPKRRKKPVPSFLPYQSTVGKESNVINYTLTSHLPVSSSFGSSRYDNLSPKSSSDHVSVQLSSPDHAQSQAFKRKQPVRSHQEFTVYPSSSLQGWRDGFVKDQRVSVTRPSIVTDQEKDLSEQNPVSTLEEPRETTDNILIPISDGLDSTWSGTQTFIQPTKVRKRPANVNKEPGNVVYWPPNPLSPSKVSGSTLSSVMWRNSGKKKRFPPQTVPSMSPSSVNKYVVRSRNGYLRSKVYLAKTHYTPNQLNGDKTGKHQQKPAPRQHKYKNAVSHKTRI